MRALLWICILALSGTTACKKRVELRPTEPDYVVSCSSPKELLGTWRSDSVHIITEVDSIDSLIVDRFPTLLYSMQIHCDEDSLFLLTYRNFSGGRTEVVRSTHYEVNSAGAYVYDPLDEVSDTSEAEFILRWTPEGDSLLDARWVENPNTSQRTETLIFFRKD